MSVTAFVILGIVLLILLGVESALKILGIVLGFMILGWWFLLVLILLMILF